MQTLLQKYFESISLSTVRIRNTVFREKPFKVEKQIFVGVFFFSFFFFFFVKSRF